MLRRPSSKLILTIAYSERATLWKSHTALFVQLLSCHALSATSQRRPSVGLATKRQPRFSPQSARLSAARACRRKSLQVREIFSLWRRFVHEWRCRPAFCQASRPHRSSVRGCDNGSIVCSIHPHSSSEVVNDGRGLIVWLPCAATWMSSLLCSLNKGITISWQKQPAARGLRKIPLSIAAARIRRRSSALCRESN